MHLFAHGKLEIVVQSCFMKEVFLEISKNSQENIYARVSEISKNTFSYRTPPMDASRKYMDTRKNVYSARGMFYEYLINIPAVLTFNWEFFSNIFEPAWL